MELDVVDLDSLLLLLTLCRIIARIFYQEAIVYSKFALRHARKLGLHDNLANNVCLKNSASVRNEDIDVLDDVDK